MANFVSNLNYIQGTSNGASNGGGSGSLKGIQGPVGEAGPRGIQGKPRWSQVQSTGRLPRARYRSTCVTYDRSMYVFGGHDGTRHLNDVHCYDFVGRMWSVVVECGCDGRGGARAEG